MKACTVSEITILHFYLWHDSACKVESNKIDISSFVLY